MGGDLPVHCGAAHGLPLRGCHGHSHGRHPRQSLGGRPLSRGGELRDGRDGHGPAAAGRLRVGAVGRERLPSVQHCVQHSHDCHPQARLCLLAVPGLHGDCSALRHGLCHALHAAAPPLAPVRCARPLPHHAGASRVSLLWALSRFRRRAGQAAPAHRRRGGREGQGCQGRKGGGQEAGEVLGCQPGRVAAAHGGHADIQGAARKAVPHNRAGPRQLPPPPWYPSLPPDHRPRRRGEGHAHALPRLRRGRCGGGAGAQAHAVPGHNAIPRGSHGRGGRREGRSLAQGPRRRVAARGRRFGSITAAVLAAAA
mmetsp:Transcript_13549/g.45811  ORF Transcript_13549/g.45811 Transcript_13549/m.45811 type:complete len:311 (-) Transcript_13549:145-1077(-)